MELKAQTHTRFRAEVKNWVAQAHIGALVNQMMQLPEPRLLVADYVNRKLAQRLKARGIQFIDTVGNAYIKAGCLYVNVRGNDRASQLDAEPGNNQPVFDAQDVRRDKPPALGRAFTTTGLKVVYVFLTDAEAIGAPYRYIAEKAEVALGTIGWVVNDLKGRGLVLEKDKRKRITDYKRLLELWAEAYVLNLRPKLHLADFYHEDPKWWQKISLAEVEGQWGGETAAAILTNYLTPTTATVYLRGDLGSLVQAARLHRQKNANDVKIEVLLPFSPAGFQDKADTVNKLPVYADLIDTADPRNIETAQMVLETP